jgi:hypothetical protein
MAITTSGSNGFSVIHHITNKNGWSFDNPGWYLVEVPNTKKGSLKTHLDLVDRILSTLANPKKHCRWTYSYDMMYYRFRYEKDYLWFLLIV